MACYLSKLENNWIQAAWKKETWKNSTVSIALVTKVQTNNNGKLGMRLKFQDNAIRLDGEQIKQKWKLTWKRVKTVFKKGNKQMRIKTYQSKEQQTRLFREQEEECQNLHRRKTSPIMLMLDQMVETRSQKAT